MAATAEGYGCTLRIPLNQEAEYARNVLDFPNEYFMPCFIGIGRPKPDAPVFPGDTPYAQQWAAWYLTILALLSLSLAILNLLPIPLLDGGHLLYYLIELVKGSPLSERAMAAGQYVGLALLAGLMGLAFYNDILGLLPQ